MTKSWEGVRQEACRLYVSGATLQQVEDRMKQRYNFKASKRAWRLKFKDWGVTREAQLQNLKAGKVVITPDLSENHNEHGSSHNGDGTSNSIRAMSEPTETAMTTPLKRSPLSKYTSLAPPLLNGHPGQHSRSALLSPAQAGSRLSNARVPLSPLFSTLSELEEVQTGSQVSEILKAVSFVPGQDGLLHIAATKTDSWTLECIIDFMRFIGISVDIFDSRHFTALEHAIRVGQRSAVERLIEGGASLHRRNQSDQQPLHFAIMENASAEICELLLQYGAEVNAPLPTKRHASSPIYLTVERLSKAQNQAEKDRLCKIFDVLLRYGAEIAPNDGSEKPTRMSLLGTWLMWDSPNTYVRWNQLQRSFRLSHFLRTDFNPLCWFPRDYCPKHECTSFASFVFGHTPESGLAKLLIRTTDLSKFGRDLLYTLLSPCAWRVSASADPSIQELMYELLERLQQQETLYRSDPNILHHLLGRAPEAEKLALIDVAKERHLVTISESREVLKLLPQMREEIRLGLAERLLPQPELAPTDLWTDLMTEYFGSVGIFLRNRVNRMNDGPHQILQEKTLTTLGLVVQDLPEDDAVGVMRCVIHYWTKELLDGKNFGYPLSAQQRVFSAAQIRHRYGLPPLPVPGDLVLAMSPHLDHRVRSDPFVTAFSAGLEAMEYGTPQSMPGVQ